MRIMLIFTRWRYLVSVGKSTVPVCIKYFADAVNVGSRSEIQAELQLVGRGHDVVGGPLHGVVQAAVHDVLLTGPTHPPVELLTGGHGYLPTDSTKPSLQTLLNALKEVTVGLPLVLEGQPPVTNVVQVLQPLEVTAMIRLLRIRN